MARKNNKINFTINIDKDLLEQLKKMAEEEIRTTSNMIVHLINQELKKRAQ